MYTKRMQQIRRTMHQRRVHETQRQVQVAAEREQMRATIHATCDEPRARWTHRPRHRVGGGAVPPHLADPDPTLRERDFWRAVAGTVLATLRAWPR